MSKEPRTRNASWVIAAVVPAALSTLMVAFVPAMWHWFMLPVTACGVLIMVDAADWVRGRLDVFEPKALVALFGVHFLYLAPLLHVIWDYWPKYVAPAQDWRQSLGLLGVVNMLGLLIYRFALSVRMRERPPAQLQVDPRRFEVLAGFGITFSVVVFATVVLRFGGLGGYLAVVSAGREQLAGTGWLLLVGEAWPLLCFALVLVKRRDWLRDHRLALVPLLLLFVVAQFLTSGLRGSRSNTIWPTLIALGMIHLVVTRVKRRALIPLAVALIGFMFVYGLYKGAGTEALGLVTNRGVSTQQLASQTGRTLPAMLLEDLGRAGTQALVVDRQQRGQTGELRFGGTYIGDIAKFAPGTAIPDVFPDKVAVGTDALYGAGAYTSGLRSSRIYGLAGEGMLNFGLLGGVLAFIPFSLFVRYGTRIYHSAKNSASVAAQLLAPAAGAAAVLALGSDIDNMVLFGLRQVLPLAAIVWLARKKVPVVRSIKNRSRPGQGPPLKHRIGTLRP